MSYQHLNAKYSHQQQSKDDRTNKFRNALKDLCAQFVVQLGNGAPTFGLHSIASDTHQPSSDLNIDQLIALPLDDQDRLIFAVSLPFGPTPQTPELTLFCGYVLEMEKNKAHLSRWDFTSWQTMGQYNTPAGIVHETLDNVEERFDWSPSDGPMPAHLKTGFLS